MEKAVVVVGGESVRVADPFFMHIYIAYCPVKIKARLKKGVG